jgi:hypothetical protein
MNASRIAASDSVHYELRYRSLFNEGRAYTFPCDASGRVDMDSLTEKARHNYLYARAVVGREFTVPDIQVRDAPRG